MKTTSHPFCTSVRREASLSLRLILFRTTAFPIRFPIVKPKRVTSRPFRRVARTRSLSAQLRPSRRTATKSFAFRRRCSFRMSCQIRGRNLVRYSETLPALEHATLENVASVFGAHPGPKPMNSGSASLARLICSLWHLPNLRPVVSHPLQSFHTSGLTDDHVILRHEFACKIIAPLKMSVN